MRAGVDLAVPAHVNVTLSNEGADKMYNLTSRMQLGHDRMAIVLDDVVKSAPTVQAILSKSFEISGLDAPGEAEALTKVLSNPSPTSSTLNPPAKSPPPWVIRLSFRGNTRASRG